MFYQKGDKGFSIIEIMIAIALIIILTSVSFTGYAMAIRRNKFRVVKSSLETIERAIQFFYYYNKTLPTGPNFKQFLLNKNFFPFGVPRNPFYSPSDDPEGWKFESIGSSYIIKAVNNRGDTVDFLPFNPLIVSVPPPSITNESFSILPEGGF